MFIQKYDNSKNVLDAARERISFIFDHFEFIQVSVSGGKDSTVLAHLAIEEAFHRKRTIGIFFLDEETMYQASVEQVEYLMNLRPEVVSKVWLQIEFALTNATSLAQGQLIAWEAGKHKLWMRPKKDFAVKFRMWDIRDQTVRDKNKGFGFYDVIENVERCYHEAAFLVGLRAAGESPNRWQAVVKNPVNINGNKVFWGSKKGDNFNFYPLYDWNFHDVWRYIYDNHLKYSKIYDFMLKKGYGINEMRVSSLIHERSFKCLVDLPEFEPKTYNKLIKRIDGIAFAQETGKNRTMFRAQKLPKNFTSWLSYRDFLLETYPDMERAKIFRKRFARHLQNEFVARQQCRQLILNDYENNLPIENKADPRDDLLRYYREVL